VAIAAALLLSASTILISFRIFRKDKKARVAAPFIQVLRSAVFGLGLIYGIIKRITA